MAVSKSEILKSISNLSVLELSELIKDMEDAGRGHGGTC